MRLLLVLTPFNQAVVGRLENTEGSIVKLDEIKEFVDTQLEELTLSNEFDDEIRWFLHEDHLSISSVGLHYSIDFKIFSNGEFSFKTHDSLTDTDLIDIQSMLSTLEDFKPYWEQVITLLQNQKSLPSDYVKYPAYRRIVIDCLEVLSDEDYHEQAWINGIYQEDRWMTFTDVINWLGDAGFIYLEQEVPVGYALRNKAETASIFELTKSLDDMLNRLGNQTPDIEYVKDPDWKQIVQLSKEALEIM